MNMEPTPKHLREMEETLLIQKSWLTRIHNEAKAKGDKTVINEIRGRIHSYNRDFLKFQELKEGLK